jgi:hypothetical protein
MCAMVGATDLTGSVAIQLLCPDKKAGAASRSKERLPSLIAEGAGPYVVALVRPRRTGCDAKPSSEVTLE